MFEVPHAQAHYASRRKSSTVIQGETQQDMDGMELAMKSPIQVEQPS